MVERRVFGAVLGHRLTRRNTQADQWRILALPYPVEYQDFWQVLAGLGVIQERLMDRMGASL